jgi:hypothetical protein
VIEPADEVLLSRYVDGAVSAEERALLEQRLVKDAELRADLADLILLNTAIDIGLGGTNVPAATWRGGAPLDATRRRVFGRRQSPSGLWPLTAAAALMVVALGAWGWWTLRGDSPRRDGTVEDMAYRAETHAEFSEVLNPSTPLDRRQDIYRSWQKLDKPTLEPLVWTVAAVEPEARARATLFCGLPVEPVLDYPQLLTSARREWRARTLAPLSALILLLGLHPTPETEEFFAEILKARPELQPRWFAERLPSIQGAFPWNSLITPHVALALHDHDELVQAYAGLARAATGNRDGVDRALGLLGSPQADVRLVAATTVNRHGLPADIPRLAVLVDDLDSAVQKMAREAFDHHKVPIPPDASNP